MTAIVLNSDFSEWERIVPGVAYQEPYLGGLWIPEQREKILIFSPICHFD